MQCPDRDRRLGTRTPATGICSERRRHRRVCAAHRAGWTGDSKGIELSSEDKARAYVIEQLMCELRFSAANVREKCGASADDIIRDADRVLEADENADFVRRTADGFAVTERGRPFLRSICAHFDAYLAGSHSLQSSSV